MIITPVRPSDTKGSKSHCCYTLQYIICGMPHVGNNCYIIGDGKQKSKRGFNVNNPGLSVAAIEFNYDIKTFFI